MFSHPRNYKRDIEHAALLEKANQLAREGTKGEKNKEEKKKKRKKRDTPEIHVVEVIDFGRSFSPSTSV